MNIETIFTIKNEDLSRLGPEKAVDSFRELIWAEATTLGIGKNFINIPTAITVSDGGIDAEVRNVKIRGGQGIIKQGLTRYQVKSGKFSLTRNQNIKNILFKDKSNQLRPRIKSCLDKNGTLVIVLFGWDNPDVLDNQLEDKFREKLISVNKKYKTAKIEIFRQNNLIGFLNNYPSLALRVVGREQLKFQTYNSWSNEAEMRREFQAGKAQKDMIFNIQNELRNQNEALHVRILGEPGIGKTRLVLESTCADDLKPLVIYCDNARNFRDSNLMNEIIREDNTFSAILVIDECDQDNSFYIWNKLKYLGARIKIITIYSEFEGSSVNIKYFHVPPLEKEEISSIIQSYRIPKDESERWIEFCGGSPRVAHVLGQNLKDNPDDLLKTSDTVDIWNRYITGVDDKESEKVQQRRLDPADSTPLNNM